MFFCTSCGAKNEGDAKFCASCGKSVGGASSQPVAPSQPAASPQPVASPQPSAPQVQVNKCPACRAPIESFQTRCSSCGSELNTAQSGESVASFFKKLDELTEREYAADKAREGAGRKKKKKQPKIVVLCEIVAVVLLILLILQLTPLPGMLRDDVSFPYDVGADNVVFIISNDSEYPADEIIILTILDGDMKPIEASITRLEREMEERLSTTANSYLVHIKDGVGTDFFYPSTRTATRMSGTINLSFNGDKIARYVEQNGRIRFE